MGPIETCNSGPKVTVLQAKATNDGLGPIGICNSGAKIAVLNAKNQ